MEEWKIGGTVCQKVNILANQRVEGSRVEEAKNRKIPKSRRSELKKQRLDESQQQLKIRQTGT